LHNNKYIVLSNNNNNKKKQRERKQNRNSQTSGFMDLSHDEFTQKSTMSVSCRGPVGSNSSSTSFLLFACL